MEKQAMTLREVQDGLYDILCTVTDLCDENGLESFLIGGTLLGAIRHNGFIPWDDDIDIYMPRADYEELKICVRSGRITHPYLRFMIPGDEGYPYPFIKVYDMRTYIIDEGKNTKFDFCLNIDIFPLDHCPQSVPAQAADFFFNRVWRAALAVELVTENLNLSAPVKAIARVINRAAGGYKGVCVIMDRRAERMNRRCRNSAYATDGAWPENLKNYSPMSHYYPYTMHVFEGREFRIPENYDANLSGFYGDYMTPPPEGSRARHSFKAYWRDQENGK